MKEIGSHRLTPDKDQIRARLEVRPGSTIEIDSTDQPELKSLEVRGVTKCKFCKYSARYRYIICPKCKNCAYCGLYNQTDNFKECIYCGNINKDEVIVDTYEVTTREIFDIIKLER